MKSGRVLVPFIVIILTLLIIPTAFAEYQYNYLGPTSRGYSINGMGGSYHQYPYGYGYYSRRPSYPPPNRPYTLSLDQYHHVEYNKPGRVGAPTIPKYYNAGPHYKSRAWHR
jgi:hypothetical protein